MATTPKIRLHSQWSVGLASRFAQNMNGNPPRVGRGAMLPKINALPGTEREAVVQNGDAQCDGSERRANMGRHIVVALGRVAKERITIGRKPGEESLKIAANFGVGVFLDEQRGGRMLDMHSHEAGPNP